MVDLKISISFANFVPSQKVSAELKITISAIKFPSKKTLKTKENNRSRGSGTNGPKTTPPVAGGRPSKLYVKVLILPTEIIFPLGEAISAEAEAAFPSRKTIFPSSKMVLLEAEAIFPSSEMTFPSRKMVLLDAEAIFPSSETIFPSRKMVLLDAEATFPSGKMTFPEAEAAFPEAEAAATAAKTTGLPVKNLKNGVKTPLPPATGGGGFWSVARRTRRRRSGRTEPRF